MPLRPPPPPPAFVPLSLSRLSILSTSVVTLRPPRLFPASLLHLAVRGVRRQRWKDVVLEQRLVALGQRPRHAQQSGERVQAGGADRRRVRAVFQQLDHVPSNHILHGSGFGLYGD
jgi:hypothetical protein